METTISGSVQLGRTYITFNGTTYTVWAYVRPYFGSKPAIDSIHVYAEYTYTSMEDVLKEERSEHRPTFVHFEGDETNYPYSEEYTGRKGKPAGMTMPLRPLQSH